MRDHVTRILAAMLVAGCGGSGGGGGTLSCGWLSGDNCFKSSAAAAAPCGHSLPDTGTFNAGRTECAYADGTVVRFMTPVDLDDIENQTWDFEIERDGSSCLVMDDREDGWSLTTSIGTFTTRAGPGSAATVTCADGTVFTTTDYLSLLDCPDAIDTLPTYTIGWSTGYASFALGGGPGNEDVDLWHCEDPAP